MNYIAPADLMMQETEFFEMSVHEKGTASPCINISACLLVQHGDFLTCRGKKLPDSIKCLLMVIAAL